MQMHMGAETGIAFLACREALAKIGPAASRRGHRHQQEEQEGQEGQKEREGETRRLHGKTSL